MWMKERVVGYYAHFFTGWKTALQAEFSRFFRLFRPKSGKQALDPMHNKCEARFVPRGRFALCFWFKRSKGGIPDESDDHFHSTRRKKL